MICHLLHAMKAFRSSHLLPALMVMGFLGSVETLTAQQTAGSASEETASRRRGRLMLAQIPQPGAPAAQSAIPAQNPNTIRPPTFGRPPIPNPRTAPAGSVAPPAGTVAQPAPAPAAAGNNAARPTPAPPTTFNPPPQQNNNPADNPPADEQEMVDIQWVNFPMPQILLEYEKLTGKKIVRDINIEAVSFTIETTGQLPKDKAIEFIEKSLLLNGYAFIPAGENILKFLNVAALKPGSEGPDIFTDVEKLPEDERIVTFVQPLQFIEADDLKTSLTELVPAHAYQVITPLPNAKGVIITDNTATIRYILKLIEHLDVEPSRTDKKSFQLIRASAEQVAESLNEILDIEGKGSGSGSSGGGSRSANYASNTTPNTPPPAAQPQNAGIPPQSGAAAAPRAPAVAGAAPQGTAVPPKIIPIARTNKLLVIARPIDLAYIESLIEELDGASDQRNFVSRPLKFMLASSALPIIQDAITRGMDDEGGGGDSSGGNNPLGNNSSNNSSSGNRTGDFGSNRSGSGLGGSQYGMGGGYGSGMGSSFGGGGGLDALGGDDFQPKSAVVGKTLIIADPVANEIFASGPPDQLQALNDVLDQLDKRPRSVVLNAVIGELTLNDSKDFGIDYLFRPQSFTAGGNYGTAAGFLKNRVGLAQSVVDPSEITKLEAFGDLVSGLTVFGTINDQVTVAISALAQNKDFKILSRPTLYTLNNKPASIETGVKVPVPVSTLGSYSGGTTDPTGGTNSGFVSNIQYQDVSLRLDIAPLIHSDDELMLQVKQVNATVAGNTTISGNSIPNISNQGLETTIMVKNNATVLLGGLISETTDRQRSGLPILKDLPIIKYITSSTKDVKDRRELLVFIQPRIVSGNGDAPTSPSEAPGASPLGDDMRRFLKDERVNPDENRETVKRSRAATLFRRLFYPNK